MKRLLSFRSNPVFSVRNCRFLPYSLPISFRYRLPRSETVGFLLYDERLAPDRGRTVKLPGGGTALCMLAAGSGTFCNASRDPFVNPMTDRLNAGHLDRFRRRIMTPETGKALSDPLWILLSTRFSSSRTQRRSDLSRIGLRKRTGGPRSLHDEQLRNTAVLFTSPSPATTWSSHRRLLIKSGTCTCYIRALTGTSFAGASWVASSTTTPLQAAAGRGPEKSY